MRRSQRIHRHDEIAVGVDCLARTDQAIEPARRAFGDAVALFAGRIATRGVMARGVAVDHQDRVVALGCEGSICLVGKFQQGQRTAVLQFEITGFEDLALDVAQLCHGNSPFGRVAILPPTGYLQLKDRRLAAARPS